MSAAARALIAGFALAGAAPLAARADTERVLNLYAWAEYFPDSVVRRFERETGIHVNYTVFDSNDVVETTLSAGRSGFDLVTPNASPHLGREIPKHLWQKLDKARLGGLGNLDPTIMRMLAQVDPGNAYAVPWMWGTTGVIYNPDKIRAALPTAPTGSLAMVFDPSVVAHFKACGVTILDAWVDILPLLARAIDEPRLAADPPALGRLAAAYAAIRPALRRVTTSGYYEQLARGETCLAIGYSGDAMIARRIAAEAGADVRIEYSPGDRAVSVWIDSLAIPADAPHPDAAHRFIGFALRPEIAAETAGYIGFATANLAAVALLNPAMRDNPAIYPPDTVRARFTMERVYTLAETRAFARAWLRMKTGH